MNHTFRNCIGAATIVLLLNTSGLAAFDLAADWSDSNNPNGVWSYREGTNTATLVNVPDWQNIYGGSPNQPAWAPSNNGGNFLPAMFKATANQGDWLTGDVVAHTWDPFNGDGHGDANYLFTAPFAGSYSVNGDVWYASHAVTDRPQRWQLLVNNVVMDSGLLTNSVTRANPDTFSLTNLSLTAGDTVDLLMFKDASTPFGFVVGTHLTVTGSAIPEPATFMTWSVVLAIVLVGTVAKRARSR